MVVMPKPVGSGILGRPNLALRASRLHCPAAVALPWIRMVHSQYLPRWI